MRRSTGNTEKFKINPFKTSVGRPKDASVEPREERKTKIIETPTLSFQNKTMVNPDVTPQKKESAKKQKIGPDKAFRLAQKIFARKVVRKDEKKRRMDTKKVPIIV